ncbi:MAG: VWA domain-containing protein [Holophagales bacterium]|nr:VWA domain-containing protein [Holophagales bacterium]MYD23884.1 VWA domain-containing protein [Holophagales bacterium]MYI34533.1 VWA domain-containing protein [Holophagales bacterium]
MKRPATLAGLFLLLSANGAAHAQQEPAPETFGETIDVRVVNVDVWVTDRDGNPVTGLTADDFEVREDGRPVELSNFYEFTDGLDATAREQEASSFRDRQPRQSDLDRFVPAEPPPPEHRLSLMVYVDNNNLTPTDRNRLLPFLRNFLSVQLSPYDRAMLAVYDAGRFEVALPFTTEAWRVAEATHEVARVVGSRDRIESQRLDILRELNRDDEVPPRYSAVMELIRDFAAMIRSEVDASIVNLENAIRTMAGLPGRKAILYISNGLPMRPAEDLFRALEERFDDRRGRWRSTNQSPFRDVELFSDTRGIDAANASLEAYQYDLSRRFDELASLANANGVTFHSVAAAGARVSGMNTADLRFSTSIEFTRAANLEEPLLRLADRTGGRAIVNTRNFAGGFDSIASDLQNRYSLGYLPRSLPAPSSPSARTRPPTHIERGNAHRIEVELTDEAKRRYRGRLSIRHRDSYIDKPVSAEMADLTLAALSMEEAANPMAVRIAPVRGPGSEVLLDSGDIQSRMLVAIPIGPLTLAPVADGHEARVRLWVQVIDGEGRVSEVTEHPVPVLVKEGEIEDARELSWPFAVDVVTAPGPHRVAVGVRDDLAATTSVVTFDLDAGNAQAAAEVPAAVTEALPSSDTPEWWLAEAAAHYQRSELEAMADAARRALELTDDIRLRTRAWNALGVALFDKPDRTEQDVVEAEEAFRRVIAVMDDEASEAPRYSLARLLADSGRPDEGVAEARRILAISPEGPIPDRARILVCHSRDAADAVSNSDRRPGEMIYQVAHEYTDEAIQAGVEGVVGLGVTIDEEGCVVGVEVLERLPHGLTESAVEAMRRAVFRPAMENGEPVGATYRTAVRFALDAEER